MENPYALEARLGCIRQTLAAPWGSFSAVHSIDAAPP